jgi:diadenosine tetraphosphate (Ap4A) HIT family hydrolase
MIQENEIQSIKNQIVEHINLNFPEEHRFNAIKQINSMNSIELEKFLIDNKLIKTTETIIPGEFEKEIPNISETKINKPNTLPKEITDMPQCIFCSIIAGEIPSVKIGENENAIAILEINPISDAHTLIIPKTHVQEKTELPPEILEFAKETAIRIKETFNPKDIIIASANILGHELLNLIPVYKDETINSEKRKASREELFEIQKQLFEKSSQKQESLEKTVETIKIPEQVKEQIKEQEIKEKEVLSDKTHWLPRRLP